MNFNRLPGVSDSSLVVDIIVNLLSNVDIQEHFEVYSAIFMKLTSESLYSENLY